MMNINAALNRLAFFLIALLLIMIILSAVIPQQDIASGQVVDWQGILGDKYAIISTLGLDRIYYTPTFFITLGLLGLSLLYGNVRRFKLIRSSKSTTFRLRYLGSIIFHMALLVLIVGIILNFLYKYEGVMALTEGQRAVDQPTGYFHQFKGPLYKDNYGKFELKLDSLRRMPVASDPGGVATFTLFSGDGNKQSATISINHPYRWKDAEFHIGQNVGYSPEIEILNRNDSTILRAFMRVAIISEKDRQVNRDFIRIPGSDTRLEIEVMPPDKISPNYRYSVVLQRDNVDAQSAVLNPGEIGDFGDVKLNIPGMRNWCYIGIVKSPYLDLVFIAFWTALSGMALGFISRIISFGEKP